MATRREREILRRAYVLYEQFEAVGEFNNTDFRDAFLEEMRALRDADMQDVRDSLFDVAVIKIADQVDREKCRERADHQMRFAGWDLEGVYRLGDNVRIAKRMALRDHMERALQVNDANRARVNAANEAMHEEYERLLPYLDEGVTKAQAVAAYEADHPTAEAG